MATPISSDANGPAIRPAPASRRLPRLTNGRASQVPTRLNISDRANSTITTRATWRPTLLARITRYSRDQLKLQPGQMLWAQIKAVDDEYGELARFDALTTPGVLLLIDSDAAQGGFWASGADKADHHVKHFNWKRDVLDKLDASSIKVADIRNAVAGDQSRCLRRRRITGLDLCLLSQSLGLLRELDPAAGAN